VDFFVDKHNDRFNKEIWLVSETSMEKLEKYDYPGNVRELENIIMGAVSMSGKEHVIMENMLSLPRTGVDEKKEKPDYDFSQQSMEDYISAMEKNIINDAMIRNFGNISRTAAELSMKRQTLQHKLKKYNIKF
jgi:Transcriptional regulator containing PAS, AAA-type ATPase, and DNA-binding domains